MMTSLLRNIQRVVGYVIVNCALCVVHSALCVLCTRLLTADKMMQCEHREGLFEVTSGLTLSNRGSLNRLTVCTSVRAV